MGFTPFDEDDVVVLEPPADPAVVDALDAAADVLLELDEEPQPAITIEIDSAISAASLRIGPPEVIGVIAGPP